MKYTQALALLPLAVNAFPAAFNAETSAMAAEILKRSSSMKSLGIDLSKDPLKVSKLETNCGPLPCPIFDEKDQYVSQTGSFAYASPATSDIRGPCPGLNAAANHGYLPRTGIATMEQTISGLGAMYNLAPDATAFLSAYAIATDGDIVEGVWSIGGPLPVDPIEKELGTGQGLSYSHNSYEGDSSIGRFDAYMNHGNAHSLNVSRFAEVWKLKGDDDNYTLDKYRRRFGSAQEESIQNNGYYFTGAFSTVAVVPAAYNFVINLMSNHSKEQPNGYLTGDQFKRFFAVAGPEGKFYWKRGQERLPENWYRRPSYNQYNAAVLAADVGIGYAAYPKTLKFGGNTGKPNTFTGVNVAQLTNGQLDSTTLFQGDNFACFFFELAQQGIPDFLKGPLAKVNKASALVKKQLSPILSKLECPQLSKFDESLLNDYPGRHYMPKGKDTNY